MTSSSNKRFRRRSGLQSTQFIRTWPSGKKKYCWLSYEPENETAKKLYASFGFVEQPQYFKDKPGEEMPAILEL
jgi:diamine N-acetyltransferase